MSEGRALVVVGALAALVFVPLAFAAYAPMQDLAAHVETSCQLLHLWQNDERFSSVLRVQPQPWANSLPMIVLAALLALWPSYAVAKLLVGVCALAWPLSLAFCFRAFGRSPWLALLALPTIFDLSFSYGFLQFIAAKPLLPLVMIAALAHVTRGSWQRGIALAVLLVVLFVTHSLVWLLAMAAAGLVIVICATSHRTRLVRLWPLALASAVTAPFFVATRKSGGQMRFHDPLTALRNGWENLGDLHSGATDTVAWLVAAACAVVVIVGRERGASRSRESIALLLVGVMVLGAYTFGPTVLPQVSVVAPRLAGTALGLLVGALPNPGLRAVRVIAPLMSLAFVWHIVDVTRSYRAFSRVEMGRFDALLERIPDGARVATHYTSTSSPHARHNALWHWPKLHCLYNAGFTDDLFAYRDTAYVVVREEARSSFVTMPHRMRPDALERFDALLVRGRAKPPPSFALIDSTGSWHLYMQASK